MTKDGIEKSVPRNHRLSNSLDPDQDGHSVDPDLEPNCLQGYQLTTKVAASKERAPTLRKHLLRQN